MSLDLYSRVALRRDIPEHSLRRGDVATLIEFVPHPTNGVSFLLTGIYPPSSVARMVRWNARLFRTTTICWSMGSGVKDRVLLRIVHYSHSERRSTPWWAAARH
ncbi:hypothetical protein RAS1_05730 [Phycisphaerae bacterium RAS1]|nr:hypothetical protein RAS1_05730 [Phycisphaerae bacterium RAS1]